MKLASRPTPKLRWLALAAPLLASFAAKAQEQPTGLYVGVGVGENAADTVSSAVLTRIQATGAASARVTSTDSDRFNKVLAGYRFHPNFAIEAGYVDLGEMGFHALLVPAAVQQGTAAVNGVTVDLHVSKLLADVVSGFVRVGVNNLSIDQRFSNPAMGAGFANGSVRENKFHYAVGFEYHLGKVLAIRGELENFQIAENRVIENNLTAFSLSLLYKFGSTPTARATASTARPVSEAPPADTPAPAPVPAPVRAEEPIPLPTPAPVAPVSPPTTLLTLNLAANALFALNSAELQVGGQQQLDDLVRDLNSLNYSSIAVTGHTDRLGPPELNQRLSTARAAAVRDYLIGAGIRGDSITATGASNSRPITTVAQCPGERSPALIACLQPDRRVEVEVVGTRNP